MVAHSPGAMPAVYPQQSTIASIAGVGPVAIPVPERLTADVPEPIFPATKSEAVRIPAAAGVKVTWIVQLSATASARPQPSVSAKSPPFSPDRESVEYGE